MENHNNNSNNKLLIRVGSDSISENHLALRNFSMRLYVYAYLPIMDIIIMGIGIVYVSKSIYSLWTATAETVEFAVVL